MSESRGPNANPPLSVSFLEIYYPILEYVVITFPPSFSFSPPPPGKKCGSLRAGDGTEAFFVPPSDDRIPSLPEHGDHA